MGGMSYSIVVTGLMQSNRFWFETHNMKLL